MTSRKRRLVFARGRGAATQGAISQSGHVGNGDRRGEPETGRAAKGLSIDVLLQTTSMYGGIGWTNPCNYVFLFSVRTAVLTVAANTAG